MGSKTLCACDRTCEKLISANLKLLDTIQVPFPTQVKALSDVHEAGLWLRPYRGIPRGPRLSRFDVIYLDESARILACSENFREIEFRPIHGKVSSAIILRSHTISSVRIKEGDQLRICSDRKVLAGDTEMDQGSQCSNSVALHHLSFSLPKSRESLPSNASTPPAHAKQEGLSPMDHFLRWLFDPRRGYRMPAPALVAYYWTGGAPKATKLGDVSTSGLYLLTGERWSPGTRIVMTLQRVGACTDPENTTRVESEVVRWGNDGVGCRIVKSGIASRGTDGILEKKRFARKAFQKFLIRTAGPDGERLDKPNAEYWDR